MFALRQGSLRVGSEPIRIHRGGSAGAENGTAIGENPMQPVLAHHKPS